MKHFTYKFTVEGELRPKCGILSHLFYCLTDFLLKSVVFSANGQCEATLKSSKIDLTTWNRTKTQNLQAEEKAKLFVYKR